MAIKWPYFGHYQEKGTVGYTQNFEIWHGSSLGTLIMIQEGTGEDHLLAIKGPYIGHFQEKVTIGYTKNCEIWHGSSLGTFIMIQEEPI